MRAVLAFSRLHLAPFYFCVIADAERREQQRDVAAYRKLNTAQSLN